MIGLRNGTTKEGQTNDRTTNRKNEKKENCIKQDKRSLRDRQQMDRWTDIGNQGPTDTSTNRYR